MSDRIHDRTATELPINSVVSIAVVTDPYSDKGEKIQVLRSIRDDPLAGMLSRRQIDEAQFQAGRKWQSLHERSTIGAIQAIDPSKEAVDGGAMKDFLTDSQMRAFRELSASYNAIGSDLGHLIFDVLGRRMTIAQAAATRGIIKTRGVLALGVQFRAALEGLAIHYGFAQPKKALVV